MVNLSKWQIEDNKARTEKYRKNVREEEFLLSLNRTLEEFENTLPVPENEPHPLILFFGPPRCGKTFFSQAVSHCMDVGTIDNAAARFWLAPATGIRLSRITGVSGEKRTFGSDYGKTAGISDPHDFAYFWHNHFLMETMPYDRIAARSKIEWDMLGRSLRRMSSEWGTVGMMKGVLPSFHMSSFHQSYRKVLFIELKRNLVDVGYSMLRARREIYKDSGAVLGQVRSPEDYDRYRSMNAHESIAEQLADLLSMYSEERRAIASSQYLEMSYNELCSQPNRSMERISAQVNEAFGVKLPIRNELESCSIRPSRHDLSDEDVGALAREIEKRGLPPYEASQ